MADTARSTAASAAAGEDRTVRLVAAAQETFGTEVRKITAPGGRRRDSLRVHFADRTVIATRRKRSFRREREVRFLSRMGEVGAPVPRLLGMAGDILFQSDAGSRRLTAELMRAEGDAREALVARAFQSLWDLKAAARKSGILSSAPPIAMSADWLGRFAVAPRRLSKSLGINSPDLAWNGLAQSLAALPVEFVKWDARPGNAAIDDAGRPVWFDWEHYGRRGGVEDFAFLIADEFWPVDPETSLRIFRETAPDRGIEQIPLLARFSTVQVAARLRLILRQAAKSGWLDQEKARRYDYIGNAPELARRLAGHGAAFAEMDPLTKPAARWFRGLPDPEDWV